MYKRICYDLSKPFINVLDNVAKPLSSLPNSLMIMPGKQGMAYDDRFLQGLPNLMKDNALCIQCPLIQSRRRSPDRSYYGKDTRMELHQLLCRLLHVFEGGLSELLELLKLLKANKKQRPPIDKLVDRILLPGGRYRGAQRFGNACKVSPSSPRRHIKKLMAMYLLAQQGREYRSRGPGRRPTVCNHEWQGVANATPVVPRLVEADGHKL